MVETKVPFVNLRAQHAGLAPELQQAIERVLERGWFILGPEGEAFEQEFAAAVGVAHAIGVGNGTDALSLALTVLGVGPGDEVVTTPLTATFSALAVSRLGARPIFADVDPETLNLSPQSVGERIGPRTRAVLPVHLYGNPCALSALTDIARSAGLALVEDACQGHGASLEGRALGSWGQAGCFSFYPTKNLGALGDGGMIVTDDDELAARLRRLRNGGQVSRYRHQELGVNSRLDELQAAVLRLKLKRLPLWNERRRALARKYRELLAETPVRPVAVTPGASPAVHLFVVRAPERDRLREALSAAGIETLIHYPIPANLQPAYRDLGQERSCPAAEKAASEIVSLPLYPELDEAQVETVAWAVAGFYRRGG
jgi:dTDP-4-amino-4,6-dideoxygalactose transaminase